MKNKIPTSFPDEHCLFCKSNNGFGFKLDFFWDANKQEASTEYLLPSHFFDQGSILHKGIQMGLLEEIMGWTSHIYTQKMFVISDLNLKFLHPAHIHENKINIICRVMSTGSNLKMQAEISNHMGVCTTATGIYHLLSPEKNKELIQDLQNKKGKKFKSEISDKETLEIPPVITPDPLERNIEWILGPDRDMNWYEAREWVMALKINGGQWRMPSITELRSLFHQNGHKTIRIHSSFKTSGWWLWSGKGDGPLAALGLDILRDRVVSGGRALVSGGRIFAVRTITLNPTGLSVC